MPIVEAVAISTNIAAMGTQFPILGKKAIQMLEQAMAGAVSRCLERGVTDPAAISEEMQKARTLMKSDLSKIEAAARAKLQEVTHVGNPEGA